MTNTDSTLKAAGFTLTKESTWVCPQDEVAVSPHWFEEADQAYGAAPDLWYVFIGDREFEFHNGDEAVDFAVKAAAHST